MELKKVFKDFRIISDIIVIAIDILIIGLSLIPSITILSNSIIFKQLTFIAILKSGIILSFSYVVFGISLIILTSFIKVVFRLRSKTGIIQIFSRQMIVFSAYHNLIHLCDVFILKFLRSTSILNWYFRLMGAKIGKGTIINTTRISDCDLISIGEDCIIGGDVIINGHSAENGILHRERVIIGNNVTIGQYVTILPGVIIGDNVLIGANTVVPKGKILKENSIYIGNKLSKLDVKVKTEEPENEIDSLSNFKDIDNIDLLAKSYTIRHTEILSIERFISQITTSTLGIIMSLIMYSLLNDQPKLIALLPTVVGFSFAIVINLSFGMLKLGAYMYRIELLFNKLNIIDFDWEIKEGILGIARNLDLDNIFIDIIYFGIFVGGFYLIYTDALFDKSTLYLNFSLKEILIFLNSFIFFWIVFTASFFWYKRNKYLKEVKDYEFKLKKTFENKS